jgi:hypothetical protein
MESTATSVKLHEKLLLDGQDRYFAGLMKLEDYNFWYSSSGLEGFFLFQNAFSVRKKGGGVDW